MDPYKTPVSELQEHVPTRHFSHAIIAAISTFIVGMAISYISAAGGYDINGPRATRDARDAIFAAVGTALIFLLARRMRWSVALLLGPLVGNALIFVAYVFDGFFGIGF